MIADERASTGSTAPIRVQATLRSGVWRVSKDGVWFGDYMTKVPAVAAAQAAALRIAAAGRAAEVLVTANGAEIEARRRYPRSDAASSAAAP